MLKIALLCLCLGMVLGKALDCPEGYVNCFVAPCMFARCDNHPDAKCVDNYCGGCNAFWYDSSNNRIYDCTSGVAS